MQSGLLKAAAACAVCLGVGIVAGRATAPEPDIAVSEAVTLVQQVWSSKTYQRDERRARVVYRERITKPDGTKVEREAEREDARVTERSASTSGSAKHVEQRRDVAVTAYRPQWRVSVLAGGTLRDPLLPIAGPLVPGLGAERRIAGPVWLGAWALSAGAAGLSLSVEF